MQTKIFTNYKEPKTREEMIGFLTHHFRYYTMNNWNRSTSYANNVKLYNLGLTTEQLNKAYDILLDADIDTTEYEIRQQILFTDFYNKTGYTAGFNGRSDGYVVLYETISQYKDKEKVPRIYPGKSIDDDEDFEDWDDIDLKKRCNTIQAFDKLCDNLRELLIEYLDNAIIHVEKYTVTKTQKTLMLENE